MITRTKGIANALLLAGALFAGAGEARANDQQLAQESQQPTRHFRVERPADLTGQDALTIYARILDDMVAAYRLARNPSVPAYRTWRKYNGVPYRSATHGQRYVNNYANALAKDYGRLEAAGEMPPGALLAKDSFAVTARGEVFSGPLFLMEKMPSGFNADSNDWRYSMIMPDGSIFGVTGGIGAARVEFCHTCHEATGAGNGLFFVPEKSRVRILNPDATGD